ncbi:MAG: TIGR03067 domain-containing protein [Steroidobacteraceae bacterium]
MSGAPATPAALDGTWVPVAARISGQPLILRELRVARLVLDRGAYAIHDHAHRVVDRGDFRVDEAQRPQAMDIVGIEGPFAGRTMLAIYELRADQLTVCYDLEAPQRPVAMAWREDQLLLAITYARAASLFS